MFQWLREVFSEESSASFSRCATAVTVGTGCVCLVHIVVHTYSLPDAAELLALAAWMTAPYAVKKASGLLTRIPGQPASAPPTPGIIPDLSAARYIPKTPIWRSSRPSPRLAPGKPPAMNDLVTWTRTLATRETYRIVYVDKAGARSQRVVDLLKVGTLGGTTFYGVMDGGRFKTFRAERILAAEAITEGHPPSIKPLPTYDTFLPPFPILDAVYKAPTTAASSRTWTVDLNAYTCTCPEKRIRGGMGYKPGQLGWVCPHMARTILAKLPADSTWDADVLAFLSDPTKVSIDNLA